MSRSGKVTRPLTHLLISGDSSNGSRKQDDVTIPFWYISSNGVLPDHVFSQGSLYNLELKVS